MYRVDRNNFYSEQKNSTVYTPDGVSEFIFEAVKGLVDKKKVVLDPCVGAGSLLKPFKRAGFETKGIDIEDQGWKGTIKKDFLSLQKNAIKKPGLVIANPPFNIDEKTKEYAARLCGRRPLLPEVWLMQAVKLWGLKIPIILFAPYGLRLNQTVSSRRWQMFIEGNYPEISSIISLPKDIYEDVLFHSEILIFNIDGLKPHYFYH